MRENFRRFWNRFRKLHLWLTGNLILLLVFRLCRQSRAAISQLASLATAIRRGIGHVTYLMPFSVMEVLCVLLVLAVMGYLIGGAVWLLCAGGKRGQTLYRLLLGAVCAGLTVLTAFTYLWEPHFYVGSFQELSGITAQPVAKADLLAVTRYFADRAAETADGVERDETGLFAVDRDEILADSVHTYDAVSEEFPFLRFADFGVKPVYFSRVMSALDFTGIYCPYTGESNVNMDSPACLLPSTAAHELAHQRSITSEQECNFAAILACTTGTNPAYQYSGWLLGYIHLGNALYSVDPDAYLAIRDGLPDTVRRDLQDNNQYWAQFQNSTAKKVSNKVYEGFLKNYGEEDGLKSYGAVVDLLVAYYRERI